MALSLSFFPLHPGICFVGRAREFEHLFQRPRFPLRQGRDDFHPVGAFAVFNDQAFCRKLRPKLSGRGLRPAFSWCRAGASVPGRGGAEAAGASLHRGRLRALHASEQTDIRRGAP